MNTTNPTDKIDSIEEQIKKLKEKKKRVQAKAEREIGKYLLKSWNITEINMNKIKQMIDDLNPNKLN